MRIDFHVVRDSPSLLLQLFDLVEYSRFHRAMAEFYQVAALECRLMGLSQAANCYQVAAVVDALHLPLIGSLAASEGRLWVPVEARALLWDRVWSRMGGEAALD